MRRRKPGCCRFCRKPLDLAITPHGIQFCPDCQSKFEPRSEAEATEWRSLYDKARDCEDAIEQSVRATQDALADLAAGFKKNTIAHNEIGRLLQRIWYADTDMFGIDPWAVPPGDDEEQETEISKDGRPPWRRAWCQVAADLALRGGEIADFERDFIGIARQVHLGIECFDGWRLVPRSLDAAESLVATLLREWPEGRKEAERTIALARQHLSEIAKMEAKEAKHQESEYRRTLGQM